MNFEGVTIRSGNEMVEVDRLLQRSDRLKALAVGSHLTNVGTVNPEALNIAEQRPPLTWTSIQFHLTQVMQFTYLGIR